MTRAYRTNTVRIIAGQFRRRLLQFPSIEGLRPTTDRMRETLFNWLMPSLPGAVCLDLFAGSGALGVEAISRGAAEVVFVDENPLVLKQLKNTIATLEISNASLIKGSAPDNLTLPAKQFDVIFVDPPFKRNLLDKTLLWILQQNLLTNDGLVFFEQEKHADDVNVPAEFVTYRELKAGNVKAYLLKVAR